MAGRGHSTALLVLLLCFQALHYHAAVAADTSARESAFIGYSEHAVSCRDSLPDCQESSSLNKCLLDPYVMRSLCPISCSVERCLPTGDVLAGHKWRGYATRAGTRAYASSQSHAASNGHFSEFRWPPGSPQREGLAISSLGLGTYLGPEDGKTDEEVIRAVLYGALRGWNVIDTAANYRGGRAELSIGAALRVLLSGEKGEDFKAGRAGVTRDALFISTKAGFLAPDVKAALEASNKLAPGDLVGGWHCITPACIRASVTSSLTKLQVQAVDLVYLHNPAEMQLQQLGRPKFLQALRGAFRELEALRKEGLVRGYGLATWDCLRRPPGHPQHLSLQDVLDVAVQVGGPNHGFGALQLPINLHMSEAFKFPWQPMRIQQLPLPLEFNETAQAAAAAAAAAVAVAAAAKSPAQDGTPVVPSPPPPLPPLMQNLTVIEAARGQDVYVFASGPLAEGSVLQGLSIPLDGMVATAGLQSTAGKLLHLVRSTPSVVCTLVGHKQQEHVTANVALAAEPRMAKKLWELVNKRVAAAAVGAAKRGTAA